MTDEKLIEDGMDIIPGYERDMREVSEKPIKCSKCGKKLKTFTGLVQHCRDKHGMGIDG